MHSTIYVILYHYFLFLNSYLPYKKILEELTHPSSIHLSSLISVYRTSSIYVTLYDLHLYVSLRSPSNYLIKLTTYTLNVASPKTIHFKPQELSPWLLLEVINKNSYYDITIVITPAAVRVTVNVTNDAPAP
jgi:hypothetical protein